LPVNALVSKAHSLCSLLLPVWYKRLTTGSHNAQSLHGGSSVTLRYSVFPLKREPWLNSLLKAHGEPQAAISSNWQLRLLENQLLFIECLPEGTVLLMANS